MKWRPADHIAQMDSVLRPDSEQGHGLSRYGGAEAILPRINEDAMGKWSSKFLLRNGEADV